MNIKLKTFFILIAIVIFSLFLAVIFDIYRLYNLTNKLVLIEYQRHQMILKADELRQSSDDLTRMARTYAITKDQKFKDAYFTILAIRDGKIARPQGYDGIYWDLSKELRQKRHPNGKPNSLKDEMKRLPYSKYEFQQLQTSKQNSDKLATFEIESFHKMQQNTQAQTEAIDLLHSQKYHQAKEQIMLPIDKFLTSLKSRTQSKIQKTHKEIKEVYKELLFIFIFAIAIIIFSSFVIYKKILHPIEYLSQAILAFKNGATNIKQQYFYKDEIGEMIAQFFVMKEKIEKDQKRLEELATTDPLTQIYNRRAFFEVANSFFNFVKREHSPLAILMLDIDFFKKINDTYGHQAGDMILKHLVQCTQSMLRESDILARYGGEEFIVLLPDTNAQQAILVAQKIRKKIEKTPYNHKGEDIYITISIGLSVYQEGDNSLSDIIQKADEALYKAKENGRNRVQSYTTSF